MLGCGDLNRAFWGLWALTFCGVPERALGLGLDTGSFGVSCVTLGRLLTICEVDVTVIPTDLYIKVPWKML